MTPSARLTCIIVAFLLTPPSIFSLFLPYSPVYSIPLLLSLILPLHKGFAKGYLPALSLLSTFYLFFSSLSSFSSTDDIPLAYLLSLTILSTVALAHTPTFFRDIRSSVTIHKFVSFLLVASFAGVLFTYALPIDFVPGETRYL